MYELDDSCICEVVDDTDALCYVSPHAYSRAAVYHVHDACVSEVVDDTDALCYVSPHAYK